MTQLFSNNASSTVASAVTNVQTTLTFATGQGSLFSSPTGGDYELLTIATSLAYEIVKMTARTGDTATIVRAQEGTTAVAWSAGTVVEARVTKGSMANLVQYSTRVAAENSFSIGQSTSIVPNSYRTHAIGDQSLIRGSDCVVIGYGSGDSFSAVAWQQSTSYQKHSVLVDSGYYYVQLVFGGTSGSTKPTFPIQLGGTVSDGTCTWLCAGDSSYFANSVAVGNKAKWVYDGAISVGHRAVAGKYSTAIGFEAIAIEYSQAIGEMAQCYAPYSIAIGEQAIVSAGIGTFGNIAIGPLASSDGSKESCIAIGAEATNRIATTYVITGLPLVRKDNGEAATDEHLYFTGSEAVVFSKEIDLKTLADDVATITIPTGATFFPDEIGVVITAASGVTGQPNVAFGVTGNTTAILTSTPTTKSAAKGRDVFTPTSKDGVNSLTASVKTAATGTTLLGRFYWKGVLVEDE